MNGWCGRAALRGLVSGCLAFVMCEGASEAFGTPIYVFKERDGTVRFTNRPPPAGVEAKVFTSRNPGFSVYKVRGGVGRSWGDRLFKQEFRESIEAHARQNGLSPALVRALIHVESAFNPRAVSPKGAQGLMQLMPAMSSHLGVKRPFVPQENIAGGTKHLAYLLGRYDGDKRLALAAYNAGEDAVERHKGIPPFTETQQYVRKVLELERRYQASR